MTKHYEAASFRGMTGVRAEVDPKELVGNLNKAFEAFKAEHSQHLEDLRKGQQDVVRADKVDRINADISKFQAALDAQATQLAALAAGGIATGGKVVKDAEYSAAFSAHVRKGEVQASLNKGADSEGGFLAPREWDRTITDKLIIVSEMRSLATVQTISGNGYKKLFNLRGTASGWVGETAARPETASATFGSMDFVTGELYANPAATQTMLDDAEVNLEAWLANEVEIEFAYQEGQAFISGSGANGRPYGLLTFVTGGANAAANPLGAIATVNSGAAAALTSDGIVSLVHALPTAFAQGARFGMNKATHSAVRKLKDGQGNYLWQPSFAIGQPATISGYGVAEIAAMPDIAAGAKPIVFGDFARTYLIIDRVGTRVMRDPYTNKPFVMFYTTKRVGGAVQNPEAMKAMNVAA
jgi:HK97 family phage major capsid protein